MRPPPQPQPAHLNTFIVVADTTNDFAQFACAAFAANLNRSGRHTGTVPPNTTSSAMQLALLAGQWQTIDSICTAFNANGVVWLRAFAADTSTSVSGTADGISWYWIAGLKVSTHSRWEIWDVPGRQLSMQETMAFDSVALSTAGKRKHALLDLTPQYVMRKHVSRSAGLEFAHVVAPQWEPEVRFFYTNGNAVMRNAGQLALAGNWTNAAVHWQSIANSATTRTALRAKAAYNLALASEMLGQLEQALEWAQRAHFEFEHHESGDYILLLRQRIMDNYEIANGVRSDS